MIPVIPWDGLPISRPGLYSGISMAGYHDQLTVGPSISSSGLRTIFSQSPAHYFVDSYLNLAREPQKTSEAFILGRGAHHLLLGEADFRKHFIVRPEMYPDLIYTWGEGSLDIPGDKPWNGNAKWCRAWLLNAALLGLTPLTPGDIKAIRGMAASLAEDPLVRAGILNGLIEHSFVWRDEATGVWLKWRPDVIPTDSLNFSDLKTAADVTTRGIQRTIDSYGYHVQAALGALACRAVLGRDMADFTLVMVEKTPPYVVANRAIRPADLSLGLRQIDVALRLFARCLVENEWPGPSGKQSDAEYVGVSGPAETRIIDRISEIERQLA